MIVQQSESDKTTGAARLYETVIVGGGIAGLSTAWELERRAAEAGRVLRCAVLEQSARWGGKIITEHVRVNDNDSFLIEGGPDSLITQKPEGLRLVRDLGLAQDILNTNTVSKLVYVLKNGRPLPLPEGVLLIIPTKMWPFALSRLISWRGKLRMGMDLFIPGRRDDADETLADFVRRRLGSEALERIAEPLMAGIYNAEADRQSIMATFPRFRAIEKKYGSLIRGMLAAKRQRPNATLNTSRTGEKPLSMFVSLTGGMSQLVETLVKNLRCDLRANTSVQVIQRTVDGPYRIILTSGATISARSVVLACPAFDSARLLQELAPTVSRQLDRIRYVSTGTISLAYRAADVKRPINGFGLVCPRNEQRLVNALTCSSIKWDHRAPADTLLVRIFFGGSRHPQMMDLSDDELLHVIKGELKSLMGIEADPILHRTYRWHRGNPQYDVGHLDLVDSIEAGLPDGLFLTGSAYRGIGIPDCAAQGCATADQTLEYLRNTLENDDSRAHPDKPTPVAVETADS